MIDRESRPETYHIRNYLSQYSRAFVFYLFLRILYTGLFLAIPFYLSYCIDKIFYEAHHSITFYALFFAAMVLSEFLLFFITNEYNVKLSNKITFQIEYDTMNHVKHSIYREIAKYHDAYLAQRINNDSVCIGDYLIEKLPDFLTNVFTIVSVAAILFQVHIMLGALSVGLLSLYNLLYFAVRKLLYQYNYEMLEAQSGFFSMLSSQIFNVRLIKLNSWFEETDREFTKVVTHYFMKSMNYLRTHFAISNMGNFISRAGYGIGIFCLTVLISQDKISLGKIAVMIVYIQLLLSTAQKLTEFGKAREAYHVSRDRIQDLFHIPLDKNGADEIRDIEAITAEDVSVGYDEGYVISGKSIRFERGKIYILRGENGSGKSTFVNTVLGLLKPDIGEIRINGISLCNVNVEKMLKDHVAFTEQEPYLLDGTILDNLFYGSTDAKHHGQSKLRDHKLLEFIADKPEGYGTVVNTKNNTLSGGEKQKIAICRSLLKDVDVMIFDEPTSALDVESIQTFKKELAGKAENKIVILITHDDRLFDLADEIIEF
ncbi:MAG: ABC transporter ATP-binding protein/permease [Clostridium sp.]|jgi:ATP-binding cassette subfamily C protein|nr:ABC transporter ATP-binding protein/permease [Clostridium sp.]